MGAVYAMILAGGSGTRMGNPDKPKQFWELAGKPVIAHTVEKFCLVSDFARVIVLVPATWMSQMRDIVERYLAPFAGRIDIVAAGAVRNDTVMCGVRHIEATYGLASDDIVVTHDAVRPFVTFRIIKENIEAAQRVGACDTVVPATDTIVQSADGELVGTIPNRAEFYQGQTPQSFNARRLKELFEALSDEEKDVLTDACKIFVLKGEPVALVRGDVVNMKLTYASDIRLARALMEEGAEGGAEVPVEDPAEEGKADA